jgi:hypothetical protein
VESAKEKWLKHILPSGNVSGLKVLKWMSRELRCRFFGVPRYKLGVGLGLGG